MIVPQLTQQLESRVVKDYALILIQLFVMASAPLVPINAYIVAIRVSRAVTTAHVMLILCPIESQWVPRLSVRYLPQMIRYQCAR